jgi:hypothetical protein
LLTPRAATWQISKLANLEAELAGRDAFDDTRIVAVLHTGAASKEERLKREREHGCTSGAPDQDGESFVVLRPAEGSVCHFKSDTLNPNARKDAHDRSCLPGAF